MELNCLERTASTTLIEDSAPALITAVRNDIPASFFGIPLGLVALGVAWQTAGSIWAVPIWISGTLIWSGAALWIFLFVAYLGKWLWHAADAKAELSDPIQSCFIGLAGVVALLASIGLSREHRAISAALCVFGVAWTLLFGIYSTGRLWMGDRKQETDTPVLYLPIVGGGFVTASAAAAMGYADWGTLAFGGALFTWFALESVILLRLCTAAPVPAALRSTLGVQLAPPAVGATAYLAVGGGAPDIFAHALIGYAVLQALLFIRLIPWLRRSGPSPAWWSFSFGAAALPTAAMKLIAHRDAGAVVILAPYLFAAGNLVIAAIAAVTIQWAITKRRPAPATLPSVG
jgi:tellurite resistance protein